MNEYVPPVLLSPTEVCDQLGIGKTKLLELRKSGALPAINVSARPAGGSMQSYRWKYKQEDVRAFIEDRYERGEDE